MRFLCFGVRAETAHDAPAQPKNAPPVSSGTSSKRQGARDHVDMRPSRNYEEWVVEKTLGSGTFGTTKLLRCPTTGERIAVKFIPRGKKIEEMQTYVVREVLNHMQLTSNPNIVGFKEVYLTPAHLCIAMEYVAGGELFDTIVNSGTFSEDVARYFFQQLISGVAFCHSQGVCHRDLKLENSLLDRRIPANAALNLNVLLTFRPQLKICDFGYSKGELDSQPKSKVGTPAYIAPEVLVRRQHEYKGEIADVWSCGVILYVMLVGAYPFEDPDDPDNFRKTMDRITAAQWSLPSDVHLSQGCLDMLRRIFEPDADKRISMAEIQQHPWFKRNLPKSMAAGGGEQGGAPQIRQSREDVKLIVAEACHVEGEQGGPAAAGGAGKHLVDYEMEDRYVDDYFDGAGGDEEHMMDTGSRGQAHGGRHIDPEYAYELGHY